MPLFWVASSAHAGLELDGSLGGASGPLTGPAFEVRADYGRQSGSNLFHSFSQFSLATNESARFEVASGVDNIIARVSGGELSRVDGRIATLNDAPANLWLINPAGWLFGETSQVDLSGDLHLSSAQYMVFADQSRYAADGAAPSSFSAAAPAAFGWQDLPQGDLVLEGTRWALEPGSQLSLSAANLHLDGAVIEAPAGQLSLLALAGPGEVAVSDSGLAAAADTPLGLIEITQAQPLTNEDGLLLANLDISGEGGGFVEITGGEVRMDNAFVNSRTFGNAAAGEIRIAADTRVFLQGASRIHADSFSDASGGRITLRTPALTLLDTSLIRSDGNWLGDAGSIEVSGVARMQMSDDARIAAFANGAGRGGDIDIAARELRMHDDSSIRAVAFGSGDSGDISIQGELLELRHNGSIDTATFPGSSGDAGAIQIDTGLLDLSGEGTLISSAGFGSGNGGDIHVRASRISLADQGEIRALSEEAGNAGDLVFEAGELLSLRNARLTTQATGGDGGGIQATAERIQLIDSQITTSVEGLQGDGGAIALTTGMLVLDTGFVQANTAAAGASGGDILVQADQIIATQEQVKVGGSERLTFVADSGINVIQAAAPDGVDGEINIRTRDQDANRSLLQVSDGGRELQPIGQNPCEVARGRAVSSLVWMEGGQELGPCAASSRADSAPISDHDNDPSDARP